MAKLIIPTPLRKFTQNQSEFETDKITVHAALEDLISIFPEIGKNLLDENGKVRQFIKIFVGDQDINSLDNELTGIGDDTVVSIIPAIAGG